MARSFLDSNSQRLEKDMRTWKAKTEDKSVVGRGKGLMLKAKTLKLENWLAYFFWTIFALLIQLIVGTSDWAFPQSGLSCAPNDVGQEQQGKRTNEMMCGLNESLQTGSERLTVLSAFIVGGFLVSSVNLWLTRRLSYINLSKSIRNLLINVNTIAQNQEDKVLLSRWAVLGFELAVLKGRKLMDSKDGREYLEGLRLLQKNEWDRMVNGERHTTGT